MLCESEMPCSDTIVKINFDYCSITAVNKELKKDCDNTTIGLLLCKEKDRLSVEWALESVNNPIGVSSYKLKKYISKDILEKLPTEEDINFHINTK